MIRSFKFLSGVKSMLEMYGREINPNHYQTISLTGNLRFLKEYHRRLDSHYASHYNIFNENHPLFNLDNVILSPHNAALTIECRKRMAVESAENIAFFC